MGGSLPLFLVISGLGGLSNLGLIASINAQVGEGLGQHAFWIPGLFFASLILFVSSHLYVCFIAANEIESIIHRLRLRLLNVVREAELSSIESVGCSRILFVATQDAAALAQAAHVVVFSIQSVLLIVFVGIYVAYLSPAVFVLATCVVCMAGAVFFIKSNQIELLERESAKSMRQVSDYISDLLAGFKEVKLNQLRSNQLFDNLASSSLKSGNNHGRVELDKFKRVIFSQVSLFLLLAVCVFIAPMISHETQAEMAKLVMAMLFIIGSAFGLLQYVPIWMSADAATQNIMALEKELTAMSRIKGTHAIRSRKDFSIITLRNITYTYYDKSLAAAFQVGPLDFTLRSGEVVIIVGGNGSGKSTFLKLLSGLYIPESGSISLDEVPVDDELRQDYRSLIVAIFGDYYLFRQLYGIAELNSNEADCLLSLFDLENKTRISDCEFETIDLSDGQRKRLALVVGLLEKRPLLLLDEWASNQDPKFRRKFYHELLPAFNRAGATLVVISHDDQYLNELNFPVRTLRMQGGRFVDQASDP